MHNVIQQLVIQMDKELKKIQKWHSYIINLVPIKEINMLMLTWAYCMRMEKELKKIITNPNNALKISANKGNMNA